MKEYRSQQQTPKHTRYKFNIMIDDILPKTFSQDLWEVIHSHSPLEFLRAQEDIMNILITDQKLFESFFKRFYLNHIQLHNWYMLAKENQLEIKKYIFRQLIDKRYKDYREILKDEEVKRNFVKSTDLFKVEDKAKERKKESFHKMLLGNCKANIKNNFVSFCDEEKQRKKEQEFLNTLEQYSKEDYHQLFLKTFNACDGNKYIYYDFDKHMKGIDQQKKYNNFIRIKKHKMNASLTIKEELQPLQAQKENSCSTHVNSQVNYFHEKEEHFEKMMYCSYNLNPIGQVKVENKEKEQYVLKKLPNVFRKVKSTQSTKILLHKKKKIF